MPNLTVREVPTIARSPRPGPGGAAAAITTGVALAGLIPIAIIGVTPGPLVKGWFLAWVVAAWSGTRIAVLMNRGKPRLATLSFHLFCYVWFGVAAMAQLRSSSAPGTTPGIDFGLAAKAMWIVIVGVGAFEIGGAVTSQRVWQPRDRLPREFANSRGVLLGWVGIIFATYFISRVGFSTLFQSRDALDLATGNAWADPTTAALVRALASFPLLIAVHVAIYRIRQRRVGTRGKKGIVQLGVFILFLLCVVNPISSARYVVGTVLLSLLVPMGAFRHPRRFRITTIIIVVALIVVFPYASRYRHSVSTSTSQGLLSSLQTSGDYDAFAQINNTILYTSEHGTTRGRQALGVALFFVPRSIWQTKPLDTGVLLAQDRGYQFTNLSAPLWAELFINGSWPAVLVGMYILGVAVRRMDKRFEHEESRAGPWSVATACLAFYQFIVLRGSLLQATAYLMVIVGSILFASRRPVRIGSPTLAGDES
jgi:hypothetical protein